VLLHGRVAPRRGARRATYHTGGGRRRRCAPLALSLTPPLSLRLGAQDG
jgi:hypothetical protein